MANRYWVGGNGNWSNTARWSTSSGGSGGASVPGPSDDAIFDGNSGVPADVTIDADTGPGSVTVTSAFYGDIFQSTAMTVIGTLDIQGPTWRMQANLTVGNITVGASAQFLASGVTLTVQTGGLLVDSAAYVDWGTSTVRFTAASTAQTITCDKDTAAFYQLRVETTSSGSVALGSDIRVTNLLHINTDRRLRMLYDIFLRGSGTLLSLAGGIIDGFAPKKLVYEITGGGTTYITGSTGWNLNGGLTGCAIRVVVMAAVTTTIRLSGLIRDVNNFAILSDDPDAVVTFYTDNYNVMLYSVMVIGGETAINSTFTSYWGSSNITLQVFVRWQWNAGVHYLQSSVWNVGTYWSVYGPSTAAVDVAQTFHVGTSFVICGNVGESWMAFGAHDGIARFYNLALIIGARHVYIDTVVTSAMTFDEDPDGAPRSVICQANVDINSFIPDCVLSDLYFYFYEVGENKIANYASAASSATYKVYIRSRLDGTRANLTLPGDMAGNVLSHDVKDSNLVGGYIKVTDASNVDSGNNTYRWVFRLPVVESYHYKRRRT